jgi:hypothetical protein
MVTVAQPFCFDNVAILQKPHAWRLIMYKLRKTKEIHHWRSSQKVVQLKTHEREKLTARISKSTPMYKKYTRADKCLDYFMTYLAVLDVKWVYTKGA